MLRPEGHGHVYCSNIYLFFLTETLCNWMRAVSASSRELSAGSADKKGLLSEKWTILYLLDPSNILNSGRKTFHHVTTTEKTVIFFQLALEKDSPLQIVVSYTSPAWDPAYPSTTNIFSAILLLFFSQTVFDISKPVTSFGWRRMLLPKQQGGDDAAYHQMFFLAWCYGPSLIHGDRCHG